MDLEQEKRIYQLNDCISFRKTTEKFGGLSNMASGYPIVINDIFIKSSEALYQAMRFPHLPNVQAEIIKQASPMTAKMISKKYHSKTRENWEKIRIPIMKWVLRVKLVQNKDSFGKLLLETDSKPIVEESVKDKFWGAQFDGEKFEGINVLGRLLMELRELYKQNKFQEVEPLSIEQFILLNNEIGSVKETVKMDTHNEGLFSIS